MQRKEARRLNREARKKIKEARKKEEEAKASNSSSSEVSSSTKDGDDDVSYQVSKGGKKDSKVKGNDNNKYAAISFNYSSMPNHDYRAHINVSTGKLPHFDGTNFSKWKHLMKTYHVGLHSGIWEIVHDGFEPPVDPKNPTPTEVRNVHLNAQATNVL